MPLVAMNSLFVIGRGSVKLRSSCGFSMTGQLTAILVKSRSAASWCIRLVGLYCVLALVSCAPRTTVDGDALSRSASPVQRNANPVPHTASTLRRSARMVPQTATRGPPIKTASNARIRRPDQSLLEPQQPPDCAFKGPLSNPPTAEETHTKLDYEQQCYRHSEMIVRARLRQLQDSVEEATKPTKGKAP
jgi:hypothetical protein